jgi:prepilin-type N-terminal cleavage/methylation domain-containing protein
MIAISRRKPGRVRRARRGVSLIELLIVISIGTVIIGLCVTTMHVLLRVERDQARSLRSAMVLSRVRQLFADDVHRGAKAKIETGDGDKRLLEVAVEGAGRVVYSAGEHVLQREELDGEQLKHRDEFHFPPGTAFHFEQEPEPSIVRLNIEIAAAVPDEFSDRTRGKPGKGPPPRTVSIEARLSRDRRFSRGER